jgi:hypothetical protein
MHSKIAKRLKRKWGDKPCDHPAFDSEYFFGTYTGSYVCTQCGKLFSPEEKDKILAIKINL